jgi:hypothetical protein
MYTCLSVPKLSGTWIEKGNLQAVTEHKLVISKFSHLWKLYMLVIMFNPLMPNSMFHSPRFFHSPTLRPHPVTAQYIPLSKHGFKYPTFYSLLYICLIPLIAVYKPTATHLCIYQLFIHRSNYPKFNSLMYISHLPLTSVYIPPSLPRCINPTFHSLNFISHLTLTCVYIPPSTHCCIYPP